MPCRYAEASNDGSANMLGAGIDSVWLAELPAAIALFLMLRVVGAEDEFAEETKLEVRVVSPEREETEALSLGFAMPEMPPLKTPGTEAAMIVPALINWEASVYGLYTLEVFLDDRRGRSIAISVRHPSELEQASPAPE